MVTVTAAVAVALTNVVSSGLTVTVTVLGDSVWSPPAGTVIVTVLIGSFCAKGSWLEMVSSAVSILAGSSGSSG